jgi:NSS family neurotransmitter:Na+ symporter
MIWCFGFFLLLVVAALTSSLSMLETPTAILQEDFHLSRRKSVLISTMAGWTLSVLCALSFCPQFADELSVFGMSVFDLFDKMTANIIMPVSATLMAIFVGWVMDKKLLRDNLNNFRSDGRTVWYYQPFLMAVRFVAPLCILLIFLHGLGVI